MRNCNKEATVARFFFFKLIKQCIRQCDSQRYLLFPVFTFIRRKRSSTFFFAAFQYLPLHTVHTCHWKLCCHLFFWNTSHLSQQETTVATGSREDDVPTMTMSNESPQHVSAEIIFFFSWRLLPFGTTRSSKDKTLKYV